MWPESPMAAVSAADLTFCGVYDRKGHALGDVPSFDSPDFDMREFMAVTKALADENRVRLLLALQKRELCLCQLVELVQLAPSTVSKHMSILKQARLVDSRKDGRWMYYRLPDDGPAAIKQAIAWVAVSLERDQQVATDRQRLKRVLAIDPSELCASQSSGAAR